MGSCISAVKEQSPARRSAKQKQNNSFHNGVSSQIRSPAANARVVRKGRKKIHKGIIGLPSNFQHTGHIGITEMRSGKVDPEKIKTQMAEVAAALRLEEQTDQKNDESKPESSSDSQVDGTNFKVKRKPTLSDKDNSSSQRQRPAHPQTADPMAEVIAALKMPPDLNFDVVSNGETTRLG
ncbi:10411_t:CDS:2 [Paraglomus occultum]|uniref:10411_t:CDS:1 n=1 Tax=Paraglomus occultum TaxID=144539 RepID=A0A9N8YV71_9GLOM|nr:10411_t:CDS:2 [Paraglomus occultum]